VNFIVFSFAMCKDSDFSSQITRINVDYFIEKLPQNETESFGIKKQVKRKQCDSMEFCGESLHYCGFECQLDTERNLPGSHGKLLSGL